MFWKSRSEQSTPPVSSPASADSRLHSELDRALDTLASVLRSLGRHAFDTDERTSADIEQRFDALAQRLLVGPALDEEAGSSRSGFQRDYGGVRRAVSEQRGHEQAFVVRSQGDMREALRTFAQALATSIGEDRAADARLGAQVGKLVGAFGTNDMATVRREAELVAGLVREASERRRKREEEQISVLTDKVRTLRAELSEARARATIDPLTQLFNRQALEEHLDRVAALGLLLGSEPVLLMIDIDHFKRINDGFGHPVGDQVLKQVADTLVRSFLRREDFVARYGGEEFSVVVTDSSLDAVRARAERVLATVRQHRAQQTPELTVTISVGAAALRAGEPRAEWLARADKALYSAKTAGRDRVVLAD